ncbi:type III pantothenate kinase [Rheinheimera fenheensis]|uniref:type III pantothenate kinase n=1 Tax=Rheinheimera fenheensis TaxID=3152295 RepID=UPI003261A8C0
MYLLLDIGNTREKAALVKNGKVTALPQLAADNLAKLPIKAVYFASVASQEKVAVIKQLLGLDHLPWRQVYSDAQAYGVRSSYQQPQTLGVDRWLAMLGAQVLFNGQNVLIADAGTAVTLDWLDKSGQHGGGWIIPGLKMQQQAVVKNTAKVFNAEMFNGRLEPGTDTVTGLQNGCLAAVLGAIRLAWQDTPADRLILTGGDSKFLKPHLSDLPLVVEPLLIFHGLARYIDM